jgi:hypothetical protein
MGVFFLFQHCYGTRAYTILPYVKPLSFCIREQQIYEKHFVTKNTIRLELWFCSCITHTYFTNLLLKLINLTFEHYSVPDLLKVGTLTPIYKNKGLMTESKNSREITITPYNMHSAVTPNISLDFPLFNLRIALSSSSIVTSSCSF